MRKAALVISGGGCKGAFAVGAVKSVYKRYRNEGWFAIVGGSSTGAIIAPLAALLGAPEPMASNAYKTMLYFYSHVTTHSVLERKNLFGILHNQSSFNRLAPLEKLIHRVFIPECFEWLQSDDAPHCYVVYVNFRNAQKVFVSPKDEGMTRDRFIQAMLASVSVPGFIEPTIISGDACYDGGLRDVIPFGQAIDLGAETIVPIFLHPDSMDESDDPFRRINSVLQRTLLIMMDETLRNDYEIAKLTNLGIQARNEILNTPGLGRKARRRLERIFEKDEYSAIFGSSKRLIRIVTGIRPDATLTDQPLTFEPTLMREWIELGQQKADEIVLSNPFDE
jgi:NTE family protein